MQWTFNEYTEAASLMLFGINTRLASSPRSEARLVKILEKFLRLNEPQVDEPNAAARWILMTLDDYERDDQVYCGWINFGELCFWATETTDGKYAWGVSRTDAIPGLPRNQEGSR